MPSHLESIGRYSESYKYLSSDKVNIHDPGPIQHAAGRATEQAKYTTYNLSPHDSSLSPKDKLRPKSKMGDKKGGYIGVGSNLLTKQKWAKL